MLVAGVVVNQRNLEKCMDRRTDPNDQADNGERESARRHLMGKGTGGDLERSAVETGQSREVVEPGEIPPRGRGTGEAKCREPGLFLPKTADWSPRSRGTRNRGRAAGEDEHLRYCGGIHKDNQNFSRFQLSGERWLGSITMKVQQ